MWKIVVQQDKIAMWKIVVQQDKIKGLAYFEYHANV